MPPASRGILPLQAVLEGNLGIFRQRRILQGGIDQCVELGGSAEFLELDLADVEGVDQFVIDGGFGDGDGEDGD